MMVLTPSVFYGLCFSWLFILVGHERRLHIDDSWRSPRQSVNNHKRGPGSCQRMVGHRPGTQNLKVHKGIGGLNFWFQIAWQCIHIGSTVSVDDKWYVLTTAHHYWRVVKHTSLLWALLEGMLFNTGWQLQSASLLYLVVTPNHVLKIRRLSKNMWILVPLWGPINDILSTKNRYGEASEWLSVTNCWFTNNQPLTEVIDKE